MTCTCTATVYCDACSAEDARMESASGMARCWVCDALAPVILDSEGNYAGTACGCDDHPATDGTDGIWR